MKLLFWTLLFVLLPAVEAHAYFDPGAGTILLQLLLGGVAGAAVLGKLYWRKTVDFFRGRATNKSSDS